jgi:hypothetical protein
MSIDNNTMFAMRTKLSLLSAKQWNVLAVAWANNIATDLIAEAAHVEPAVVRLFYTVRDFQVYVDSGRFLPRAGV